MVNLTEFTPEQQVAFITNKFAPAIQNMIDNSKNYELLATALQQDYTLSPEAWELLLKYYENLEHIYNVLAFIPDMAYNYEEYSKK
jgi:hypothetical protein